MAQEIAVAEAAVPIDRECRVVGYRVVQIEAAEPAVSKMQLDLLAQSPLEADAVAVADQQHPEHEFGIDRRTADFAIEGRQLLAQIGQHPRHNRIHPTQQMAFRNALFEVEQVEQLALIARLLPHHRESPSLISQADGITVRQFSRALFQQHRPNSDMRGRFLLRYTCDQGPDIVSAYHRP